MESGTASARATGESNSGLCALELHQTSAFVPEPGCGGAEPTVLVIVLQLTGKTNAPTRRKTLLRIDLPPQKGTR